MKLVIIYFVSKDRPDEPLAVCEKDKAESLIAKDIEGDNARRRSDYYIDTGWELNKLWYEVTQC